MKDYAGIIEGSGFVDRAFFKIMECGLHDGDFFINGQAISLRLLRNCVVSDYGDEV